LKQKKRLLIQLLVHTFKVRTLMYSVWVDITALQLSALLFSMSHFGPIIGLWCQLLASKTDMIKPWHCLLNRRKNKQECSQTERSLEIHRWIWPFHRFQDASLPASKDGSSFGSGSCSSHTHINTLPCWLWCESCMEGAECCLLNKSGWMHGWTGARRGELGRRVAPSLLYLFSTHTLPIQDICDANSAQESELCLLGSSLCVGVCGCMLSRYLFLSFLLISFSLFQLEKKKKKKSYPGITWITLRHVRLKKAKVRDVHL